MRGTPRGACRWRVAPSRRTALLHCHHCDVQLRTSAMSSPCLAMLLLVLEGRVEEHLRDARRPYAETWHARGIAGVKSAKKRRAAASASRAAPLSFHVVAEY